MGALKGLAVLAALLSSTAAHAGDVARWHGLIAQASARFGVPEQWIERVMQAESAGHTQMGGRPIRSRKGAIGLMQLMPGTWQELRLALGLPDDPDDPRANILAGTYYLRLMYDRFGYPGLFAAYNAGPGRYAEHVAGRPLPVETLAYIAAIGAVPTPSTLPAPVSLFAVRRDSGREPDTRPDSLFAIRTGND